MSEPHPDRLRVLQCVTHFALGGAEQVALALALGLRDETVPGVFAVHGQSGDAAGLGQERGLRDAGIAHFGGSRLPYKAGGALLAARALDRAVAAFRPQLIHCHAEHAETAVALWRALRPAARRVPVVRTVHNSEYWRCWPRIGRWCDGHLRDATVVAVSAAAREEFLRQQERFRRAGERVEPPVIYNGIAAPRLAPRPGPRQADECRLLFAGRFEEQKGLDVLGAALPLVRLPAGGRGVLRLIGRGSLQPMAERLAQRPPAGWRVELSGPVAEIAPEYSAADLAVLPSRFEGLGLVSIEATLAGLPVIVADAPGLRETVPPNHPWLVPPADAAALADAISRAVAGCPAWEPAVRAAQDLAATRFSPARMAEAYARIYRHAVSRPA